MSRERRDEERGADLPYETETIGRHSYRVGRLPFGQWLELEALLLEALGPSFAELLTAWRPRPTVAGQKVSLLDLNGEVIGRALYRLSTALPASTQERVLELVGTVTQCDGHALGWREMRQHWPRYMAELLPFVAFAMGVQFADFFDGALDVLDVLPPLAPQAEAEADETPRTGTVRRGGGTCCGSPQMSAALPTS